MNTETSFMLALDRVQFAATIIFHYSFPQFTMGLAFMIGVFATRGYWWGDEGARRAARFWTRIFAITFAFGVATGVPMEFQFGTNSRSGTLRARVLLHPVEFLTCRRPDLQQPGEG